MSEVTIGCYWKTFNWSHTLKYDNARSSKFGVTPFIEVVTCAEAPFDPIINELTKEDAIEWAFKNLKDSHLEWAVQFIASN